MYWLKVEWLCDCICDQSISYRNLTDYFSIFSCLGISSPENQRWNSRRKNGNPPSPDSWQMERWSMSELTYPGCRTTCHRNRNCQSTQETVSHPIDIFFSKWKPLAACFIRRRRGCFVFFGRFFSICYIAILMRNPSSVSFLFISIGSSDLYSVVDSAYPTEVNSFIRFSCSLLTVLNFSRLGISVKWFLFFNLSFEYEIRKLNSQLVPWHIFFSTHFNALK